MFAHHRKSFTNPLGLEILFKISIWISQWAELLFTLYRGQTHETGGRQYLLVKTFPKLLDLKHLIIKLKMATLQATSTNHSYHLKSFHNSARDLLAIIVLRVLQTNISITNQEI